MKGAPCPAAGQDVSQYAMFYIMALTIADLTCNRAVRNHSKVQRNSAGNLVQSHGSNSIVSRRGQFFNVFYQGIFDGAGTMIGRSTFKQCLAFRPDRSIQTLNTVDIRWTQLPLYQYSLDVIQENGSAIGPWIAVGRIKDSLRTTYLGICLDDGDQLIGKDDIGTFRLYYSNNNTWTIFVHAMYDGVSDQLAIYLSSGTTEQIALRWNERITGTKYSLDVLRSDGIWIYSLCR